MKRTGFQVMAKLIGLVAPLTHYMILAILMGLLGHLCATFITVFGGFAILQKTGNLRPVFAGMLLFALLRGFLRYGEQRANHFIAFKLLALIRDRVFGALRRLCPAKLEGRDKGDLISVITSDIELLEVFYAHTISPIAIAILFSTAMVCFIGRYHYLLGLLAAIAYLTVGLVIPMITSKLSGGDGMQFRSQSGALAAFVLDSLRGLPQTVQFGQGGHRLGQMAEKTAQLSQAESKLKRTAGRNTAATNSIILLFDLAMLLFSAKLCGFEGCLITTLTMMSSFGPVVSLATLGATLQNTFAAGNRVLDILEEDPVTDDVTGMEEVTFTGAAATHVTFGYGEETILRDVSLTLPKNQITGIQGPSGSGKSTLLKLLMRFWETQQGEITLSNQNVNRINTRNLRALESYMTQETHLFHDSIRNNLLIAKPDATEKELIAACKKASIHDFIQSLPHGYDTQVGELGDTLSGGERQRLGLSRAFLHDAPLLLLDEPTSNLDSLNEAVILKSLHESCTDKTVVLVSHRSSTMGIAHNLYRMDSGRMC